MEESAKKNLSDWGMAIIGLGLFSTVCILIYQFYHWLKSGEWLSLPLYKALQNLGISFDRLLDLEWQGMQKFLFWVLELPIAGVIGVSSLAIGWLMSMQD